ncbi:hypothetical protein GCM10008933_36220 [Paenibacillus motobuensis]|uniref:Uncharacterized protein n=1 Tax=Paenibacillus motobuensis TaxID=295324 RepID=A0ABN0YNQ2_9BACL
MVPVSYNVLCCLILKPGTKTWVNLIINLFPVKRKHLKVHVQKGRFSAPRRLDKARA